MAQGFVRALRNVAETTIHSLATRQHGRAGDDTASLVPTPVATTIYVRDGGRSGQQLAGTGELVWEGEVLERPAASLLH